MTSPNRCSRCNSPDPKRHPAVQFEGGVHTCPDPWHSATSPNRDRADRDATKHVHQWGGSVTSMNMVAAALEAAYDERDRLLAEAEQAFRQLRAIADEPLTGREESYVNLLSTALADRGRYKDALADVRNELLRDAIDYAETCAYDQRSMLTAAVHAVFDGLLTLPDRSAARQMVIELATRTVTVAGPDPSCDCLHCQLSRAVQELQSPQ